MNGIRIRGRVLTSAVMGGLFGSATLGYEKLALLSENPVTAAAQNVAVTLLMPGMIGAIAVGGNIHVWNVGVAAALNMVAYFGLAWFCCSLLARVVGKRST